MIKEFAFGVTNRHHFQDANKIGEWQGLDSDTFTSLYDYDEYVVEYYAKHNSLSIAYFTPYNACFMRASHIPLPCL